VHFKFLVEDLSTEAALQNIVPRVLGQEHTYEIHPFGDKLKLFKHLPARLRAYRKWIPDDWCIVVLVDCDSDNCQELKGQLESTALDAGFATLSTASGGKPCQVITRIAIEELEAWFFGDVPALAAAYQGVPTSLGQRSRYRYPDAIAGGTWEALERVLQRAGYFPAGISKIAAARHISTYMNPETNRSPSFRAFRDALRKVTMNS